MNDPIRETPTARPTQIILQTVPEQSCLFDSEIGNPLRFKVQIYILRSSLLQF